MTPFHIARQLSIPGTSGSSSDEPEPAVVDPGSRRFRVRSLAHRLRLLAQPAVDLGSGPAGRPALVDLVIEPHDLAVLELECVGEGGVKVRATLVLAREAARDHDCIAPVIEVLGAADELVEVLRYLGEYLLAHRLGAGEGSAGRVAATGLGPLDVLVGHSQDRLGLTGVEVPIGATKALHILL